MQKLVVILGPTSSGKSNLAVDLARKYNGEVISADSRQVYKGLDIGTGKITKKEMKGVKHHLLDVANPKKQFTVADFMMLTNNAIAQIVNKGKMPIICGGTGFYIDSLLGENQIPEVPPNSKLRKQLEKKTAAELFKMLKKLDPERAKNIDAKNPRRLIRAIEIAKTIGKVPKLAASSQQQVARKYDVLKIGIKIPDEKLKKRINERLDKRIKQGMITEAKRLHERGLSYKRMRELGLEYGTLADLLEGKINKEEMVSRLQKEIWHYAKRQMTWFKRDKSIYWVDLKNLKKSEKSVQSIILKN